MAQTVTTQMNEFRRLEDGRIVLDGLVWSQYAEKAIEVTDPDNGFKVFNINLDGVSYYPVGYDKRKKVFIARNSWGTNWGDKGYFYMPFDIVKPNMSSDYWIIKSVNNP